MIELGDKRQLRSAAAQSGREMLSVERQAAQLDVLAEVTRRFIAVAAAQEQLALTQAGDDPGEGHGRRCGAARPGGEVAGGRTAALPRGIQPGRNRGATRDGRLGAARQRLAAMWGSRPAGLRRGQGRSVPVPAIAAISKTLPRAWTAIPTSCASLRQRGCATRRLRLVSSLRKPDSSVSGGVRRLEETNDQALVMGISVPLFSGRRAAPVIAEAEALRELVDVERGAARIQARTQLYGLYEQLRQAIRETETLQRDVMPQLEEALKATRYAYERGRYGYLELVDAQRTRFLTPVPPPSTRLPLARNSGRD